MTTDAAWPIYARRIADAAQMQRTRAWIEGVASRIADKEHGCRLRLALNDAHLRYQFALVRDDPASITIERQACVRLIQQIQAAP